MKKLILIAVAVPLLVAASASAKAVDVDISKVGFAPASVTLQAGDSITWTNKDSSTHQVVCKTCPFTSQVLSSGGSYSYVFLKEGKFAIVDPLNKNKKLNVTVKAAASSVTVEVTPAAITYGKGATVSGSISSGKAGQMVEVFAWPCSDTNEKRIATVKTTSGGLFTFAVQPPRLTTYHTRYAAPGGTVSSSSVNIGVRPLVALKRVARGKFSVSVSAAESFAGKVVAIQRYVGPRKRKWITLRTVRLGSKAPIAGGTIVSSGSFKSKLPAGVRIRAVLPPVQAAPCYLAASSATVKT